MPDKPIVTEIAVKNQQTGEYEYADIGSSANLVEYDNTSSALVASNIQEAIDEVNTKINNKSTVTVTQVESSGTKVATVNIDGANTDVYAPTPINVVANPNTSGVITNLTQLTVDSTTYNIPQGTSSVSELSDLNNVTISSIENGQILKYNAANQEWVNANESGGGGGDTVTWTQITQSGSKIAEIDINGTTTDVYAPEGGSSVGDLDDLGDVTLTSPTNGQVLKYDNTNQKWVNANESGGGGSSTLAGLDDTNISSLTADQDLSYDSTSSKWINKTHRVELTKAQYDALPSSKLTDGIEYFITDMETTGVEIVANPQETATDTLTKLQIGDDVYNISSGGSASWKDITGTLTAGQTSITLTDSSILVSSTFDFYTSKFGVNPTDISVLNGSITLTFDEQSTDLGVKVRVTNETN